MTVRRLVVWTTHGKVVRRNSSQTDSEGLSQLAAGPVGVVGLHVKGGALAARSHKTRHTCGQRDVGHHSRRFTGISILVWGGARYRQAHEGQEMHSAVIPATELGVLHLRVLLP